MNPLRITSYVFITNAISCALCFEYIYAICFGVLTLTSVGFHTSRMDITTSPMETPWFIIDQIAIFTCVMVGTCIFFKKATFGVVSITIAALFGTSLYIFYYGYLVKQYCYDPNIEIQYKWHSMVHYIISILNHLVLFL